jgi:myo-inositol-1(or 4)-monophosphatase
MPPVHPVCAQEADNLLDGAIAAARAAGGHALAQVARRSEVLRGYAHDVKLQLDVECQALAEKMLLARFPDSVILGEEGPEAAVRGAGDTALEWVIDPIDGTVNYSHGLPVWCCSVAVRRGGVTLAGAVYAPVPDELYSATCLSAATCNARPIRVSAVRDLGQAMIMTGLDKAVDPRRPAFEIFRAISIRVQKARVMGSAALDMCRVAAGQADGYFESGIFTWDIAAAGLIVQQAGGRAEVMGSQGGHRLRYLASNGLIHDELRQLILGVLPADA